MKKFKLLLVFFIFLLSSAFTQGQGTVLKGKVVDDLTGQGVPGASVTVEGSNEGTRADLQGNFTLRVSSSAAQIVLQIGSVGFATQTITTDGKTDVVVRLQRSATALEEIVVTGYGTQKKKDVTGAIATFDASKLDERPIIKVDQALVGQMAGVRVKQTSGLPGEGFSIQVRGTGSISANNEPLYVIDGFPLEVSAQNSGGGFSIGNPLSNISPNDIESIHVLKDASTTAIYGSRGSNGVVLITTKRGKAGKATINFNTYVGYNERVRELKMLDAEGWIDRATDIINATYVAKAGSFGATASDDEATRRTKLKQAGVNVPAGQVNPGYMLDPRWSMPGHPGLMYVDWQKEFFRKGLVQDYQLSASGGTSVVKYYVSGDYLNQDGISWGVTYKRYSARANVEVKASDKVRFGLNIAPSYSIANDPGVDGKDQQSHIAASLNPVIEADAGLLYNTGPYTYYAWGGSRVSPVEAVKRTTGETKLFRTLTTVFGEYSIIPGLALKSTLNLDNYDANTKDYTPVDVSRSRVASGRLRGYKRINFVNENTLSFNKTFAKNHNVSAVTGLSYSTFNFDNWTINGGTFSSNDVTTLNAASNGSSGTSTETKNVLISYYGRVEYDFNGRYLLTASVRRDGSSKFGANTKWGWFPAVSAGWRISDENFMQNVPTISELKLRGSWGLSGNNGYSGDYNSIGLLSFANYSFNGSTVSGQIPDGSNFANPDLGWEQSETINVGFDLGLLHNRIYTSLDYYTKRNTDLLLRIPVPTASGFSSALTNIGEVLNKGWELEITTRNFVGKKIDWSTSLNVSFNSNEVKHLGPNNTPLLYNGGFDIEHSILMVGQPMYSLYLVQQIGLLTTKDIADGYPRFGNEEAGDPKYFDANNDGKISPDDRVLMGGPNPDYVWGITNKVSYKGFDLSVLVQGQWGGYIYSMFGRAVNRTGQGYSDNALASYVNRWRSPADDGKPGLVHKAYETFGRIKNTDWLYSSDYWRIRDITIGYNLSDLIKNNVITKARIYVTAENMFGEDRYYGGWNPEAVNTSGEDYGSFPLSKGLVVGLNITF